MNIDHLKNSLTVSAAQLSVKGVKAQNEDCVGIRLPEEPLLTTKGLVAVIADGVSSADAGKEASEASVQGFLTDYFSTPDSWTVKTSGQKILTALNRWLYGQGQKHIDEERGYITTLSALVVKSQTAFIFHVGDTRIYRYRSGDLEQLTEDHTAHVSPGKSYLARAMGIDLSLEIDFRTEPVEPGDLFILTTDGVHDYIPHTHKKMLIERAEGDLQKICADLVQVAADNQSPDNLSCQVLRIESVGKANADDLYRKLSELSFPPALSPGMILDGYKIIEEIHASTRSQLYVVEDSESGRRFVMKTPSVNFEDDPAYIERFTMEEWVGSRIDSQYVVDVVPPLRPRQFVYYLVEHIEGQSLAEWIIQNPKPEVTVIVEMVEKIAKGLRAFHRRETLHQDLKPDNIILSSSGDPVIIDFGSVYVAGVQEISTVLQRDFILGTAGYGAPEYKSGRRPTENADLFSLGAICYELLTGQLPYGDKIESCNSMADYNKLNYSPAYHHNPLVPVWMDGAIKRAVQVDSRKRYEVISEFVFDLSHPNSLYADESALPLVERNPLLFWKTISGLLLAGLLVSLAYRCG